MNEPILNEQNMFEGTLEERGLRVRQAFSSRFKELRLKQGYTQERLSSALHVSRGCLCAWEHGLRMPAFETLIDISRLFNVSCDYILGVEPGKLELENFKGVIVSNKSKYLDISNLSDKNLKKLLELYMELNILQSEENSQ